MATYDISGHGLLSEKAENLAAEDMDAFDANATAAEFILQLNGTAYEGDLLTLAKYAIVYQVNFQLENNQESELYSRISEGDRTYEFKEEVGVSPMAQQFMARLKAEEQDEEDNSEPHGSSKSKSNVVIW